MASRGTAFGPTSPGGATLVDDDSELDAQVVRTDVVENDYFVAFFHPLETSCRSWPWTKMIVCSLAGKSTPTASTRDLHQVHSRRPEGLCVAEKTHRVESAAS